MATYIISADHYSDAELGRFLYQGLSVAIEGAEPWFMLSNEDQAYYAAAARDFLRMLWRSEGKERRRGREHLWIFDFVEKKATKVWMYKTKLSKDPREWFYFTDRRRYRYILDENCFMYEDEALLYGQKLLEDFVDDYGKALQTIDQRLQEVGERGGTRDFVTVDNGESPEDELTEEEWREIDELAAMSDEEENERFWMEYFDEE